MRIALFVLGVSLASIACGAGGGSSAPADAPQAGGRIAAVHRSRCGTCHQRVEPGERTRSELETALARHRKRVRLTEEEWGRMVDYLAAPAPTATSAASVGTTAAAAQ